MKKKKEMCCPSDETKGKNMDKILVIDDDHNILKVIKMRLESQGYAITTITNANDAINRVQKENFDLALVDLKLNGMDGIDLMKNIHQINQAMPILILTAYGTIKNAVRAMKEGAYNYLTKPFDYHELLSQIKNCLEKSRRANETMKFRQGAEKKHGFESIIGKSKRMEKVLGQVARAAEADSNVYIEGESGTGKELIAKSLHMDSSRRDGPFVVINCAAIPENLLESELFGYQRGAFTGADKNKIGLFAQAHRGTFFFDEVSEMPLSMQAKLLRVLEKKEFYPLGAREIVKVDVRIIAASNRNLEEEIKRGKFRHDLFYRIHVIPVGLPPLRERKEDIPILAEHFLSKFSRKMKKKIKGFSPSVMQKLMLYEWPGNIRELENMVECAVALSSHTIITDDLILCTQKSAEDSLQPLKDAKEDFEKNYITQLVELTQGNITQAAKLAGKYRADFYDLLKKYDLKPADFRR